MNYFDQKIFSYYFKIKFKLSPHFGHFPSYFMLKKETGAEFVRRVLLENLKKIIRKGHPEENLFC